MVHVLSPRSLLIISVLSSTLNLMWGDKSIGNFLKRQIRKYISSTSNNTNHKLWMDYLEKRLEIICRHVNLQPFRGKQIFSILQFYKTILKNSMLSKMCSSKDVSFHDIIQRGIFGSVSAIPKDVAAIDVCIKVQDEKARELSYKDNWFFWLFFFLRFNPQWKQTCNTFWILQVLAFCDFPKKKPK